MFSLLTPLVACLALQVPDAGADPSPSNRFALVPSDPARIELETGRAMLLTGGERVELPRGASRALLGPSHLEVATASEVRIAWGGRASLHVTGPCSLEWGPRRGEGVSAHDLRVRFHQIGRAELEVRRGEHDIELPGDWHLRVGAGAVHFEVLPSGPTVLRSHAGPKLAVHWFGDRLRPRPPVWLVPGGECRLVEPPVSVPDRTGQAPPWEVATWPWRRRTEDDVQRWRRGDLNEQLEGQRRGPAAWPAPAPLAPGEVGAHEQLASLAVTPPSEELVVTRLPEFAPVEKPAPKREAGPVWLLADQDPPVARDDYQDFHWRGVRREQLHWAGPVIVQGGEGLETTELRGGRVKVLLTSRALAPLWAFSPLGDVRLEPGAVVVFGANGRIEGRFGRTLSEPVVLGRPTEVAPPPEAVGVNRESDEAPTSRD